MMSKTHIAVGVASSLLITQPKTKEEVIVSIIGGAIGGVLSDIDVKINNSNKHALKYSMDALYGELAVIILTVALLFSDYINNGGICSSIIEKPIFPIIGGVMFILLTVIGECSKHRGRTHSLLFMILYGISSAMINVSLGFAVLIGYASHLIIDLFNKSPILLLYPLDKEICLKLFYADGFVNELLFIIGLGFVGFYLVML